MLFHVDPSNGLAIYDQIVRHVKFAIAGEALRPGELVPSVRELARGLAVNPNTVARAYRELQSESVLAPVRGTGLEVTTSAPRRCREARLSLIRQRLQSVFREALDGGLDSSEIKNLADVELRRLAERKERS